MIQIKGSGNIPGWMYYPENWREKILTDLFWFCKVVLHHGKKKEYRDLNWIHKELCDFLDFIKNPNPQKLVIMLRDGLKSSIARAVLIQWFLNKRYRGERDSAFIYSGIVDLAEDHLSLIVKEIIENEIIQAFFYKYLPHNKKDFDICSKDKIRYKGIDIDAGSPEKSLTGHHYGIGINDNLVNEVNSQSAESRAKAVKRWQQQEPLLKEDAQEIIFETTWWPDDLSGIILDPEATFDYSKIYRKPCLQFMSSTGYSVFTCPARGQDGQPVFPEKVNEKYLARKRAKMGPYLYNALYELQPTIEENVVFPPSWIRHYEKLPQNYVRNLVIDCAGTKAKESSYTAMTIGDWDEQGTLYIPYAEKRKASPMEVKEWAMDLIQKSEEQGKPIYCVGIEKEKYGIFLADILRAEEIKPFISLLSIRSLPEPTRLAELESPFNMGKILSRRGLRDYEKEIKSYYHGKKKDTDILNTLYYHFRIKCIPQKSKIPEFEPVIADDFSEQLRRILERQGEKLREIARSF